MNWKLSRISIPVFDLEKSKNFYNFLLNDKTSNNENLDTDEVDQFIDFILNVEAKSNIIDLFKII